MSHYDLSKTQFLEEGGKVRAFKRKRVTYLFDPLGYPVRPCPYSEWKDMLHEDRKLLRTVWILVPIP